MAKAFLALLKTHDFEFSFVLEQREKWLQLLDHLLPVLTEKGNDWVWLIYSRPACVSNQDVHWLIGRLSAAKSLGKEEVIAKLIERVFDYRNTDQTDAIISACLTNPTLANTFKWFLEPVTLYSEAADQMKAQYQEMQSWQQKHERPALDPPPEKRVALLLERCESEDIYFLWQLTMEMSLMSDSTHYGSEWVSIIVTLPGWTQASEATQARILNIAERYVIEADPHTEKWLGTDSIYYWAMGGYRALLLLLEQRPEFVNNLSKEIWAKWAPIILVYDESDIAESKTIHQRLTELAYAKADDEVIKTLITIVDQGDKDLSHLFKKLEHCWDENLTHAFVCKLKEKNLSNNRVIILLRELLVHGVDEARAFAESLVLKDWGTNEEKDLAVSTACLLLRYTEDASWGVIWPAIEKDVELGQEVFMRVAGGRPLTSTGLGGRLTEGQLADLYIWLVLQYPHKDDPRYEGVHTVGPRESIAHWRDSILAYLRGLGTNESCEAIRRIIKELPDLDFLKWALITAESNTRRRTWLLPLPDEVVEMLSNKKQRLVRNGEELLDAVVESLRRLEARLQGETPAAIDVWSQVEKSIYKPKDENHFSDYIKRFLDEDLKAKGIIVNREVEIRRSMGGNQGERTDILVDAVTRDLYGKVYDSVSAIIEVKGSWNEKLNDAMQTQLVDRYLKDNSCRHGLYLVGWFNCPQWDIKDPRRKQSPLTSLSDAQARLDSQAESLSTQHGLDVRALVINASLR